MSSTSERNQAHLTFYESLVQKYPNQFAQALRNTSEDELKKVIVLDIGESTNLHLSGLASHPLTDEIPFILERFEKHKEKMRIYLTERGLPEEILDLAIQFGTDSFNSVQQKDHG